MENAIDPTLLAKSEEVRFEASRITSLLSLCADQGIMPGFAQADVDAIALPFLLEPTDLGFLLVTRRLAMMHKHLHELLYAPPRRS